MKHFHSHYQVYLATGTTGPLTQAAQALGVPVYILPSLTYAINPLVDSRALYECIDLLRTLKPALVHVHSSKAGILGRIAASMVGIPSILTAHGWGFKPGAPAIRRRIIWLSEFLVARLTDHIICVSHYDQCLAKQYGLRNKHGLSTIHHGLHAAAPLATPANKPVRIIMTARFQEPKDQELLLHAFAATNAPDAQLVFVGGDDVWAKNYSPIHESQAQATKLGVVDRVHYLGDRDDVPDLLAQSHIFVLLSRYEGLPLSVLEAMRAGLPVIASDVGGVAEEVEHGLTGFLVERGNVRLVQAALQALIDNAPLRQRMGQAGRDKFLREFIVERMLQQFEEVYIQILGH